MGKKRSAPLDRHLTIRLTEKEFAKITGYCADNEVSSSEYLRNLIRVHLGMANDLKRLFDLEPRPRK